MKNKRNLRISFDPEMICVGLWRGPFAIEIFILPCIVISYMRKP